MDFTFTPSLLGLQEDEASAKTVRDLWKHATVGVLGSGYKATVGVHDVVAIRVGAGVNAPLAQGSTPGYSGATPG